MMARNTQPDRGAAFIAALTATDQLDGMTATIIHREDSKAQGQKMQRLCFLAEAAYFRACAVYHDELADMYGHRLHDRRRFDPPTNLAPRMAAVRLLCEAVDRYVAFPARNKTQAAARAINVRRWQHHVVGGFEAEDVQAFREHGQRWVDAIEAERTRFSNAPQRRQRKGVL